MSHIAGFTDAKTDKDTQNNQCDVCGSKESTRWFGNTSRIVCSSEACRSELQRHYDAQVFHGDDEGGPA